MRNLIILVGNITRVISMSYVWKLEELISWTMIKNPKAHLVVQNTGTLKNRNWYITIFIVLLFFWFEGYFNFCFHKQYKCNFILHSIMSILEQCSWTITTNWSWAYNKFYTYKIKQAVYTCLMAQSETIKHLEDASNYL